MTQPITIKLPPRTVVMERELELPEWAALAIVGHKINAIKALREVAGISANGDGTHNGQIGLRHAKRIVEDFMFGISTWERRDA